MVVEVAALWVFAENVQFRMSWLSVAPPVAAVNPTQAVPVMGVKPIDAMSNATPAGLPGVVAGNKSMSSRTTSRKPGHPGEIALLQAPDGVNEIETVWKFPSARLIAGLSRVRSLTPQRQGPGSTLLLFVPQL